MSNKIVKNFYVDGSMLERIEKYGLTFSSFARRSLEWTIADLESGRRSFDPNSPAAKETSNDPRLAHPIDGEALEDKGSANTDLTQVLTAIEQLLREVAELKAARPSLSKQAPRVSEVTALVFDDITGFYVPQH